MQPYSDLAVERYIASGDPFDKAGAYAIQHPDFDPVNRLDRCYANVVGLPLCAVVTLLQQAGCDLVLDLQALCRERFDYDCPARDIGMSV
jgi:predicted house-cleaning NTP pyrophosphatase (Maf/HAM1 superfamily)